MKPVSLRLAFVIAVLLAAAAPTPTWAWGKKGHEIVSSVAARVLAERRGNPVLRPFAYDLGYYSNVPDVLWKNLGDATYKVEGPQHFLDWSPPLAKAFGSIEALPLTFAEYKSGLGAAFDPSLGVAPYRIRDMVAHCKTLAQGWTRERHPALLVCLGTLSHYTGDLGQPLHVTDDYDGKAAGQPGIHAFFETTAVDALDAPLHADVLQRALQDHDASPLRQMTADKAVRWLIADSYACNEALLKVDKATGRTDVPAAAEKHRPMLVERMARAAILTAVIWDEILGPLRSFGDKPLYGFDGCPVYLDPDPAFKEALAASPAR
jgi:hypothetical protein